MPYSLLYPGLGEALRARMKAILVADLANVNSALNIDAASPITLVAGQIVRGDAQTLTRTRISILGGGENDGQDVEMTPTLSQHIFNFKFSTNVYLYIHPDECPNTDADAREEAQEIAIDRLCDHLRARLFNDAALLQFGVASREYQTVIDAGGYYDHTAAAYIRTIYKGMYNKNYSGGMWVKGAHLIHVAEFYA